jgi:hypothetical protein
MSIDSIRFGLNIIAAGEFDMATIVVTFGKPSGGVLPISIPWGFDHVNSAMLSKVIKEAIQEAKKQGNSARDIGTLLSIKTPGGKMLFDPVKEKWFD